MKDATQLTEFYERVGAGLRALRKKRKLSQDALANLVGLTRTSLTNIESGRQHPPLHTFCDIVEQLQADFHDVVPRTAPMSVEIDLEALEAMVRGDNELAFIENAIGMKARDKNGDTTKKDSSTGGGAPQ